MLRYYILLLALFSHNVLGRANKRAIKGILFLKSFFFSWEVHTCFSFTKYVFRIQNRVFLQQLDTHRIGYEGMKFQKGIKHILMKDCVWLINPDGLLLAKLFLKIQDGYILKKFTTIVVVSRYF